MRIFPCIALFSLFKNHKKDDQFQICFFQLCHNCSAKNANVSSLQWLQMTPPYKTLWVQSSFLTKLSKVDLTWKTFLLDMPYTGHYAVFSEGC